MSVELYRKTRPHRYRKELEDEFARLKIAQDSFKKIQTPRRYWLEDLTLTTEKIGAGSSDRYKHQLPPEYFVSEYINLLKILWKEKLKTSIDLTPKWVREPQLIVKKRLHPDFQAKSETELEKILARKDDYKEHNKVVVHGDLCPVNIVFNASKRAVGLIDLGDMHMGNKMLDIAVLSWTIRGNFGRKYEEMFLHELGVDRDDQELEYYRLIYDLNLPSYKNWLWIKEEQ